MEIGRQQELLSRINYGVLFHNIGDLDNSAQIWVHTFQINLPNQYELYQYKFDCNPSSKRADIDVDLFCNELQHIVAQFQSIRHDTRITVTDALDLIYDLIPNSDQPKKQRTARAIFSFIGRWSKAVFGTSTTKDLEILQRHMMAMNSNNEALSHEFQEHVKLMTSFMTSTDDRINEAMIGISDNHNVINSLISDLQQTQNGVNFVLSGALSALMKEMLLHAKVDSGIANLIEGVHQLVRHKLSPNLIPLTMLNETINKIDRKLITRYKGQFRISTRSPEFYYNTKNIVYARQNNSLYVTVGFPITSTDSKFDVYQVRTFPTPLNQSSNHATKLSEHAHYFAVDQNGDFFIEISDNQKDSCFADHHWHCPSVLPQKSIADPTCLSALFFQQTTDIMKLCDFSLIPNGVKPNAIEIQNGEILVTEAPSVTLVCTKGQQTEVKKLPGCKHCIIQIQCLCSVTVGPFYFPPRFRNCQNNPSNSVLFPVNLPLLQSVVEDETKFDQITPDTVYAAPAEINFSNLSFFENNFRNMKAVNQKAHINLQDAVQRAKSNMKVFQYMTDPIMSGEWLPESTTNEWTSGPTIMSIITLIMSTICSIAIIILAFRVRVLWLALLARAEAREVRQYFTLLNTPPTTTPEMFTTPMYNLMTVIRDPGVYDHLLYVCIGVLLVVILIKCLKITKGKLSRTNIAVEISEGTKCLRIPLCSRPQCPQYLTVAQNSELGPIELKSGFPFCKFILRSSVQIINKLNQQSIFLPSWVYVTPWKAHKIKGMLQGQYDLFIVLSHGGQSQYVPVTEAEARIPLTVLYENDKTTLYPTSELTEMKDTV